MTRPRTIALVVMLSMLVPFANATVRPAAAAPLVTVPLAGTTSGNGTFDCTLAISSVGVQNGGLFVEGIVTGTVARANKTPLGTVVSVPVRLPLAGNWPQVTGLTRGPSLSGPVSSGLQPPIVLAQTTCAVLHLEIGAVNFDALGVVVSTSPITLDLSGDTSGPLGALVCAVLNLVGSVANLVNLLTQLLGTLGGALGGAVGGGTPA
jgi:hypothetical protein